MNRTAKISISIDAYDDETEEDRLECQSKILNQMIDFCRENVDGYIAVGCSVTDDHSSILLHEPKKYKYKTTNESIYDYIDIEELLYSIYLDKIGKEE